MSEFMPPEQKEMYERALKALNRAGRQSEHHKPATTKEEVELMKQTNLSCTQSVFSSPMYRDGQYELIFANPLATTAYIYDHKNGVSCGTMQVWQEPYEILEALNSELGA